VPRLYQVDAFTRDIFKGNPAGVCLLDAPASEAWMQSVGAEMNLSETAFLSPQDGGYLIRYFTPEVEVELCGHATLASAHVLWEEGLAKPGEPIRFQSMVGGLTAEREQDWLRLDFPADPVVPRTLPDGLSEFLGATPLSAWEGRLNACLVELESEDHLRFLRPSFEHLRRLELGGLIVTARAASPACDFVSRFFAPDFGIDEDPVTGVAHCSLGPYWAERLDKTELVGHQVSRRGGVVKVRVRADRVHLLGQAVTVIRGDLVDEV
jgi:PhzF family phenazine biosynthesis protein